MITINLQIFVLMNSILIISLFYNIHNSAIIFRQALIIIFLKQQLSAFRKANLKARLRINLLHRIKLALLYRILGYPQHLCYAFVHKTLKKWFLLFITNPFTFLYNKTKQGRPAIATIIKKLIIKIKKQNPEWGVTRIQDEIDKFLHTRPGKSSIYRILKKYGLTVFNPQSPWHRFIRSIYSLAYACDFKVVNSVMGIRYYVFFIISYKTRKIVHYTITKHPTKKWIERQLTHFSDGSKKLFLVRDNDQLFKHVDFKKYSIQDINIAFRAPDMNSLIERFIGSFNREALNKFYIFNQKQLRFISQSYVKYYNNYRPHQTMGHSPLTPLENQKKVLRKNFHPARLTTHADLCGVLHHYSYRH